ncbi:hypothetical protein [Metallosphaera javensis (ex Sakai et al. 2022)]|uniref:hypothetical protein n=1 Tax=Metallosphaera javensis (ex Sakai et al. 2022) TaxID=2775498 RepID=UPI0025825D41|nr:MAG: chromosome partition protein Smc [Metallosphaera javensis (ex Sakai et al. 2022)]
MSTCEEMFSDVMQYSRKDILEIEGQPPEERIGRYNQIKQNRGVYERECTRNLSFNDRAIRLGYFDLALIRIASTMRNQGVIRDFTDDEYSAFSKLDQFLNLDYVTPEEIATALFNKRGKIYDVVKKWYDEEMYEFEKLIDPEGKKVRQTLASALRHEYLLRFERIKKGIVGYFDKDPGAPRELFSEYEEVIRKQYEAEIERMRIEENARKVAEERARELEMELEAVRAERENLTRFLDSFGVKGESLQGKISSLITSLQGSLTQLQNEKRKLEQEKANLLTMLNQVKSQVKVAIEAEVKRYEDTNRELEKKIGQLRDAITRLEWEKLQLSERIEQIKNASSSAMSVKFDEARILEINFLGRFQTKMNATPRKFLDPIRGEEFEIKNVKDYAVFKSEENPPVSSQDYSRFPRNTEITYVVRKGRLLRDDLEVVVKAKFLCHMDSFASTLYDNRTVGLSDVLPYLDKTIEVARKGQALYVIGIASPTGFSEDLKKYVASDDFYRNFTSYYVTLCLVDLMSGEVIYNRLDERLKEYKELFEPELEVEKMERFKKVIKEELMLSGYVTLTKAIEKTGGSSLMMKKVFIQLQKEGVGRIYEEKGEILLKLKT